MVLAAPPANLKNLAGSERFKQNKKSPAALHVWELWNCVRFMNKEQGWEKKQLLLKRRSLSPSCPPAFWVLDRGSSPSPVTPWTSAVAAQTVGSTCTPCCREDGGPKSSTHHHLAHWAHARAASSQPCSQTCRSCHWKPKGASPGWEPAWIVQRTLQGQQRGAGTAQGEEPLLRRWPGDTVHQQPL